MDYKRMLVENTLKILGALSYTQIINTLSSICPNYQIKAALAHGVRKGTIIKNSHGLFECI